MQWFKHDANSATDAKLRKLIIRHGTDGYAIYFHCLELVSGDISETNLTFELEHDAEIIADNLKIKGTPELSAIDKVNTIMKYIIELGLFQETKGRVFCLKMLKRLDLSMTSNTRMRKMITKAKEHHDPVMINHDSVMQEENRIEEKRRDNKPKKHKHGEYKNILLTEAEHDRLKKELGDNLFTDVIAFYSAYKEEKGTKTKSDNLTIRRWVIKAVKGRQPLATEDINTKNNCIIEVDT
jgi:hypothetical protein